MVLEEVTMMMADAVVAHDVTMSPHTMINGGEGQHSQGETPMMEGVENLLMEMALEMEETGMTMTRGIDPYTDHKPHTMGIPYHRQDEPGYTWHTGSGGTPPQTNAPMAD